MVESHYGWCNCANLGVSLVLRLIPDERNPAMHFRRKRGSVVLLLGSVLCFAPRAVSQSKPVDQEAHIRRIEARAVDLSLNPNEPPVQLSLQKLMELYKIPGFSIA